MRDADDVVYWLQERALRRYGATMNAAHTKTQEWLWADEITRLREELAAVTERMSKLDFERTAAELERDALREENARLRLLVKTAYAEGCYDSTKTEKTQEEFEALWRRTFSYKIISGREEGMSDDSDDVVRRYNGARPMQAPAKLLDDAIREVEILREENARLREGGKDD